MNNQDHISKTLETIFWVIILKFFDADPGSGTGMEKIRIRVRDEHPGSTTLVAKVWLGFGMETNLLHQAFLS
jgi:hypothetical protein